MNFIQRGKMVYTIQQVGECTVESFFDNYYNVQLDYINSVLYVTIRNYIGQVASEFNQQIPININGDAQIIDIVGGVGEFPIVSDWIRAETWGIDIRNATLTIGNQPDRLAQLEADNAMLMLAVAEAELRQTQTDQTIAELMLAVATGGA